MSDVICEDGQLVFIDGGRREALLDISRLMLDNRSRYPMQVMPDGKTGITRLLLGLMEKHGEISCGKDFFPFYLLDILVISSLIRTSAPLKVLEIGATSGILSYHLAVLMGKLNRDSLLCCVSNVAGNGSKNQWLDRVSMVEEPPNLSMLISDYDATQLQTGNFDLVILNGTDWFDKPYETVREAERLVKKTGTVLCHTKDAPLLESSFKLVFPERREYGISPQEIILAVNDPETAWKQDKPPVLDEEMPKLLQEIRRIVRPGCRPDEVRPFIREIDRCADLAVKYFDTDRKAELIRLKGAALDYLLNIGKETESYYRNELVKIL